MKDANDVESKARTIFVCLVLIAACIVARLVTR